MSLKVPSFGRLSAYLVSSVLLVGVVAFLAWTGGLSSVLDQLGRLSVWYLALIFAALLANAVAAAARLQVVSTRLGHPLGFGEAAGTVGASSIAGALFFQIAGQLASRGALMGRKDVPFEAVVVMTLFERVVAAIFSFILALGSAYFIFGHVVLDQKAGGADFIKLTVGLLAATGCGAALGYGRAAAAKIQPESASAFPRVFGMTLLMTALGQLSMMAAYVLAVHQLAAQVSIVQLTAASCLVMFAASIPISLAGWGIREMSAVAALGAIGVPTPEAFTAAVLVGVGSLLAMGVLSAFGLRFALQQRARHVARVAEPAKPFEYRSLLHWALPIAAAMFVFFQVYAPTSSGTLLNINLADPIAILCGALLVLEMTRAGGVTEWRFRPLPLAILLMTVVLTFSLFRGAIEFGWTGWAVVNRYFGWFVLLSYACCGALLVRAGGERGLRMLLLTFAAAACAISWLELLCLASVALGIPALPVVPGAIEGFSQNHNFFAFQLLMAIPAVLVAAPNGRLRAFLLSTLFAALYFSGSRSGWISGCAVMLTALALQIVRPKDVAVSLAAAGALVGLLFFIGFIGVFNSGIAGLAPHVVPAASANAERMQTILGGLALFEHHPIFGAGLGAYRSQMNLATSGIPLLIHSSYLWLLAELGLVGLLAFAIPAIAILYREITRTPRDGAAGVLILALVAFAVMSIPADMVYQRTFWLVLGAAVALAPRAGAKAAESL